MKKALLNTAKIVVSVAILSVVLYKGWVSLQHDPTARAQLIDGEKQWGFLSAAAVLILVAVLLSFIRWYWLVRAQAIDFTMREAMRLGFVGYLLNFSLSIVGGDVIKAVAIAHRSPGKRAAAAATVIVDRMMGLYALFVVGAIASLFIDFTAMVEQNGVPEEKVRAVKYLCEVTQGLTIAGAIGFALVLLPGLTTMKAWNLIGHRTRVGRTINSLLDAVRLYRRQPMLLIVLMLVSLSIHAFYALAFYCLSRGFEGEDPTLGAHFVIGPLALVTKALPLPGGLGAFEAAFAFLYQALSGKQVHEVQGLVIALAYRVVEILVALVGVAYYAASRREVRSLMAEAEQEAAKTE